MRLSKRFASFVGISLSCEALLMSKHFVYCDISSPVIGSKENLLFFIDSRYHFFDDRDTWMIFIFLYSFFNWVRNVASVT